MKRISTYTTVFALLAVFSSASYAGLSEDKNGVLHCTGASSCDSLKTACTNGHATFNQTSPTTGTCTVGAQSALGLKAKIKQSAMLQVRN
jgi:hypothetical protein